MSPPLPLSVCLIARDEERHLGRLIGSVRGLAAEVVVVDTGSRDATQELARSLGARLLETPWTDDFSAARNVAIAAATQPWILSIDADQELAGGSRPALQAALSRPVQAQIVMIDRLGPDGAIVSSLANLRLWRNDPRIRFQGRVHEDIAPSLLAMGCSDWPDSGLRICDHSYVDAAERQRKRERNLRLLRQAVLEQPDDLYLAYKLALSLPPQASQERDAQLLTTLQRARRLPAAQQQELPFLPRLFAEALNSLTAQGRLAEAVDHCQGMTGHLGSSLDFSAGRALARAGDAPAATHLLRRFLDRPRDDMDLLQHDPDAQPTQAWYWLGWLASQQGHAEQAEAAWARGLEEASPRQTVTLACELLRLHLRAGRLDTVAEGLNDLAATATTIPHALAALMLLSAELSQATGDIDGAAQFADLACQQQDDRAAALRSRIARERGESDPALLSRCAQALRGRRYDTLAERVRLTQHRGLPWRDTLPAATRALLARS
ncbi:glycosyltransferase [Ideonella sp. B7]|uniref:glycosyltransferase family 2 protein n=1 Tax=Ideonella benzenivorans TaxID=2831643 RepID=UPI001CEC6021|nr:glycosyltransferase family 2 protein [Ideonella benzenivorans]MCA6217984.1 glycosyltransferase [Ideonella benzenivorans]